MAQMRRARNWCLMMIFGAVTMSAVGLPEVAIGASEKKATRSAKAPVPKRATKASAPKRASTQAANRNARSPQARVVQAAPAPTVASVAQLKGLRGVPDLLALESSVALVVDQESSQVLFSKNHNVALPIASITKLMTALVVLEAAQPLDELIEINRADLDTEKNTNSRLSFGTWLSRDELLHIALMSSENRAANALGRNYPGGLEKFVQAMNAKAQLLGMHSTRFVDPTGLSSRNIASAHDLARLVQAASQNPAIRSYSTGRAHTVQVAGRQIDYRNTNALVINPAWDIALQKTGYIREAGRCLVMNAIIDGKAVVIVLLDSVGRYARLGDADRIRQWMSMGGSRLM